MIETILINLLIGFITGVSGILIKTYLPQLNPVREGLVKMADKLPNRNEDIIWVAEDIGEKAAAEFLKSRLTHTPIKTGD